MRAEVPKGHAAPTDLWSLREEQLSTLDLHEVTEGRWASGDLVRGRERGARQYLRRDSGGFARIHHHRPHRGLAAAVATVGCLLFMGWALSLLGCAAYRSSVSLEGELDDLGSVLLEEGVREDLLATVGVER
jgi:hypothetical protein